MTTDPRPHAAPNSAPARVHPMIVAPMIGVPKRIARPNVLPSVARKLNRHAARNPVARKLNRHAAHNLRHGINGIRSARHDKANPNAGIDSFRRLHRVREPVRRVSMIGVMIEDVSMIGGDTSLGVMIGDDTIPVRRSEVVRRLPIAGRAVGTVTTNSTDADPVDRGDLVRLRRLHRGDTNAPGSTPATTARNAADSRLRPRRRLAVNIAPSRADRTSSHAAPNATFGKALHSPPPAHVIRTVPG